LGRADADSETVDKATSNQHADVLGSTRDDGSNDPNETPNLNSATTTKLVSKVT
jgi:hypothetical protein